MAETYALFALKCLYLMLPAYFANMMPVIVKKINLFVYPLDFNLKIGSRPVLGKNKTFRGLIFGTAIAIITTYFQFLLYKTEFFRALSFVDYGNWLLFGFLMGFGALTGDFVKSFFKRRIGIKPGAKFVPFDQIDFVIGALVFIAPIFPITISIITTSLLLSFTLHVLFKHLGFYLKVNPKW